MNANLVLGKDLKIFKLTSVQAAQFSGRNSCFSEMLARFGQENMLQEKERYTGYVAVYYSDIMCSVVYMNGHLEKYTDANGVLFAQLYIRNAVEAGTYYRIVSPMYDNVEYDGEGIFQHVWNFNDCNFDGWVKDLQKRHHISSAVSSSAMDCVLKRKLQQALISSRKTLELTEEEYLVLKSYAPDYFRQFFSLVD